METQSWMETLKNKFFARVSHFFLLHLNVADEVHYQDRLEELEKYLALDGPSCGGQDPEQQTGLVAYFNRGTGIQFISRKKEENFLNFLKDLHSGLADDFYAKKDSIPYMLQLFNLLLKISWDSPEKKIIALLENHFGKDYRNNAGRPFFTAIIQYAETIVPANSTGGSCEDRNALVSFQIWAKNKEIRNSRNLIILLAQNLTAVSQELSLEANDITPIKIPLPDYQQRLLTIQKTRKQLNLETNEDYNKTLADLSSGLTNKLLANLINESYRNKIPLTPETVFAVKKKFLEDQSNGLLKIIRPAWGLEAIGSLESYKEYILDVIQAIKERNFSAVPMGVLLIGPPGVGKTVFAEALAHEAGIPMIIMKNQRSPWLGVSETNQDFSLELIKAFSPVIVFSDEIEQQYQARGTTFHGDSGVSARLQAQIFQFLSDTSLRGKVLWVAASNRPDLLDQAMIREGRFDEVLPFFPPTPQDRPKILEAILQKQKSEAEARNASFEYELSADTIQKFGWWAHCHHDAEEGLIPCDERDHKPFSEEGKNEITYTGAEIEARITVAKRLASKQKSVLNEKFLMESLKDFIPKRNLAEFELMIDLALSYTNSEKFIPEKYRERARKLRRKPAKNKNRLNLD